MRRSVVMYVCDLAGGGGGGVVMYVCDLGGGGFEIVRCCIIWWWWGDQTLLKWG